MFQDRASAQWHYKLFQRSLLNTYRTTWKWQSRGRAGEYMLGLWWPKFEIIKEIWDNKKWFRLNSHTTDIDITVLEFRKRRKSLLVLKGSWNSLICANLVYIQIKKSFFLKTYKNVTRYFYRFCSVVLSTTQWAADQKVNVTSSIWNS